MGTAWQYLWVEPAERAVVSVPAKLLEFRGMAVFESGVLEGLAVQMQTWALPRLGEATCFLDVVGWFMTASVLMSNLYLVSIHRILYGISMRCPSMSKIHRRYYCT